MARIYYINNDRKDSDIDVAVEEVASKDNRIGAEILKFVLAFLAVALLVVLTVFSISSFLRQKNGEMIVTSRLTNDEGDFAFKGWEITPALESAIEAGDVSLKNIIVIEKGGEITFSGGDANKIAILDYRTEIEDNVNPQIYSDEYFEELKRQGKNTYVVKTIGLATEATKEGAE